MSTFLEKRPATDFELAAAMKMLTLPASAAVWRDAQSVPAQHSKRQMLNLRSLPLEVPALLHLCVSAIPKLPLSQHEMAQCLAPLPMILEHVTKEHASMSVCHAVMAQILASSVLPLPLSLALKYLDLYAHFDEFGASPVAVIEAILRRYIPPFVLQHSPSDTQTQSQPKTTLYGGALRDFAAMTKSDGDDDAMEPFSDDMATGAGFKVVPLSLYTGMQRLLSRFSSAHGLGVRHVFGAAPPESVAAMKREVIGCAERVWRCMEWDGHDADCATLNLKLDTLCKWDEMTAALSLFERLVGERVVEPDNGTLYALADAMVHPLSIEHFVREVAPKESAAALQREMAHAQDSAWHNMYKHKGQVLDMLTSDRVFLNANHGTRPERAPIAALQIITQLTVCSTPRRSAYYTVVPTRP